ncbi:MAG: STAS domain-containing protein [Pseudomonadota bacterium]
MTTAQNSTLTVRTETIVECRLVRISGRIDHTNSDNFLEELSVHAAEVSEGGGMVVDLGEVEYITSAGLRALLLAQRTLTAAGARLVVTRISGVVKEVFRISKFDSLLSVSETIKAAVSQISPSAAEAFTD